MHTFLDAKAMAKALRAALAKRNFIITHGESLELVAQQFGLSDWNVLAARIAAARSDLPLLPPGWYRTGTGDPAVYRMGVDPDDSDALRIESLADGAVIAGRFGSLGRTIDADGYRGGSIRLSVELRGKDCDRAFIWLRVDPEERGEPLAFDNLGCRTKDGMLSGTFGWTRRTIILPVVQEASRIPYGVGLIGTGTVWSRDITVGPAERGSRPDGDDLTA